MIYRTNINEIRHKHRNKQFKTGLRNNQKCTDDHIFAVWAKIVCETS